MSARKKGRVKTKGSGGVTSLLKSSLAGFGVSLLAGILLLLGLTALSLSFDDPESLSSAMALGALFLSSLAGGFVALKMNGSEALLCGASVGALMNLALLVISLFVRDVASSDMGVLREILARGAVVLMAVLGAYLGTHRKKRRRGR